MTVEELKAYVRSRVGAILYPEHAERICQMIDALTVSEEPKPEEP